MKYGNINTQAITENLSKDMPINVQHATPEQIWEQRRSEGWRRVIEEIPADDGYRITSQGVEELSGETCRITRLTQANIADEAAANAAAEAAAAAAEAAAIADRKEFESQLDNGQVIVRALALALLDEINLLREWTVAFKTETAAATSLANLQTRVKALSSLDKRTVERLKTAVHDKAQTL